MTPLTILFWVIGLIFLLYNLSTLMKYKFSKTELVLLSSMVVYFSIYFSDHIYQSLYWRTGMLTYTSPMVFLVWIFAILAAQSLREKPSGWLTVLAGILALLGGGFSEAGTTVMVSSLGLYVVFAAFMAYRYRSPWAVKSLMTAGVALFFALMAMAMLIFAPTTQIRKGRYGEPASLPLLIKLLFNFTYAFFVAVIKNYQYLVLVAISALLGVVEHSSSGRRIAPLYALEIAALIIVLAILFVAASLTPSAYIEKGLPAPRTMVIPRFVLVFAFVAVGRLVGITLRELVAAKSVETIALVLLFVAYAFPVYSLFNTSQKIAIYRQRTKLWDIRNAVILDAINKGEERVTVLGIDGQPVGGIRDFDPNGKKGFWISKCAMDYYGIRFKVELP